MKKQTEQEICLRITLVCPPPGVVFCLQRGRADLVAPTEASGEQLSFDFALRVHGDRTGGPPNLRGDFAQGPPATRFVYVNSGTSAGQKDSCWTRRAKVPLSGITWELIEQAISNPGIVLEARIPGTAKDGGSVCASVRLQEGGWLGVKTSGGSSPVLSDFYGSLSAQRPFPGKESVREEVSQELRRRKRSES